MSFKDQVKEVTKGKDVLTLIIKKKYFDQIIAGTKKRKTRFASEALILKKY